MSYVKHILFPNERILYDSKVHPRVLVPGMLVIGLAAFILHISAHTGQWNSFLLNWTYRLGQSFRPIGSLYVMLANWQNRAPDISLEIKILGLLIALGGISKFMRALLLMQNTELIVTDKRIIAKVGIMTIITQEMDRHRVAGVTIDQTMWGRMMGYGEIYIQGFTSTIGGLPIMVNPHKIEQFIQMGG